MLIAKVQDGQVVDVADYQSMFPQTSFPASGPNDEFMLENSCMYVNMFLPYDHETQVLQPTEPYIMSEDSLHWVYTVKIVDLPPVVVEPTPETV